MNHRSAFTLIELLVVIAIIAILSIVVVLTLSPQEMLRQSRDATRLSDLDTMNRALSLYVTDFATQGGALNLGNTSTVYVSLIDNASSTCGSWNLPALPTGYTYHCSSATSSRNIDSNGWLPVNLKAITTGSPLGSLPIDPQNNSSTGLYYTYVTNGSQYMITSLLESQKYKAQYGQNPQLSSYPEVPVQGSNLTINPLFNPQGLVGYWPMDEGMGTVTNDMSGNNDSGTTYHTFTTPTDLHGVNCKISGCITFDGIDDYIKISDSPSFSFAGTSGATISFWFKASATQNAASPTFLHHFNNPPGWFAGMSQSTKRITFSYTGSSSLSLASNNPYGDGGWHFFTATLDNSSLVGKLYIDVVDINTGIYSNLLDGSKPLEVGGRSSSGYAFSGSMDDVRIYNRALSASEIQALYNAEK